MPFGLSNALTTFQAVMNDLFYPYLRNFMLVFFDDMLIYSKNWNSHLNYVETILNILEDNTFYANKSKCSLGQKEIEFLGHIVSSHDIKGDHRVVIP